MKLNDTGQVMRLQVFLAHAGAASRRSAEKLITDGRVTVNGRPVTILGEKVGEGDEVCLDGRPLKLEQRFRYILLNKPPRYICSSFDPQGRPLALDLLPAEIEERLYSIGRLDYLSSGLIIFTNDGNLASRLGHPRSELEKEYLVEASGPIPDRTIDDFKKGIFIDDVLYQALKIERLGRKSLRITLIEGKNREIRRVFSFFHLHPLKLQRVRVGPIRIGDLEEGRWRALTGGEMEQLGVYRALPEN
ncbi:MAG: rRNA pseudouridine synthase [Treponema sp.]|nr:rRNA pseudouridine synthase [Treponema sp.]